MVKKQEVNHFQHIGGNLHVNIESPYTQVNNRQYYREEVSENKMSELLPGRGIFLKLGEWSELCKVDACLNDIIPILKNRSCLDCQK